MRTPHFSLLLLLGLLDLRVKCLRTSIFFHRYLCFVQQFHFRWLVFRSILLKCFFSLHLASCVIFSCFSVAISSNHQIQCTKRTLLPHSTKSTRVSIEFLCFRTKIGIDATTSIQHFQWNIPAEWLNEL